MVLGSVFVGAILFGVGVAVGLLVAAVFQPTNKRK
jgi:hypothetical protein